MRDAGARKYALRVPGSAYYAVFPFEEIASMATPAQPPASPGTPDLASRIYVELVGRAFLRVENAAVIKPEAAELAKLSFQLAETFRKVEKAVNAASMPQNVGYKVDLADMAKWEK